MAHRTHSQTPIWPRIILLLNKTAYTTPLFLQGGTPLCAWWDEQPHVCSFSPCACARVLLFLFEERGGAREGRHKGASQHRGALLQEQALSERARARIERGR